MTNRTLLEQIEADRDLFMDPAAGLAEPITVAGVAGNGIYQAPALITAGDFESVAPSLKVWTADFASLTQGQAVSVRSIDYTIARVLTDTYGISTLILRRASV